MMDCRPEATKTLPPCTRQITVLVHIAEEKVAKFRRALAEQLRQKNGEISIACHQDEGKRNGLAIVWPVLAAPRVHRWLTGNQMESVGRISHVEFTDRTDRSFT